MALPGASGNNDYLIFFAPEVLILPALPGFSFLDWLQIGYNRFVFCSQSMVHPMGSDHPVAWRLLPACLDTGGCRCPWSSVPFRVPAFPQSAVERSPVLPEVKRGCAIRV